MVIYMRHKIHGTKVAVSEDEAKYDEKNGWERYTLDAVAPVATSVLSADEMEALRSQYERKFGKKPHHFKTAETLKRELEGEAA